jgi:HK97 family phage prohead protease
VTTLSLASPGSPTVDAAARTITGVIVPYGPVGQTSAGRLQFSRGSLALPADLSRVKLLREHAQADEVVGYLTAAVESDGGMVGTFYVPETPQGDKALAEAAAKLRDAFSVGAQLDDKTATDLRRANGAAVQGRGQLREVSLVSVPAFDDARVGAVAAHADLTVSSWSDASTAATTTPASSTPTPGDQPMSEPTPTPAPTQPTPTPAPTDPNSPTQPAPVPGVPVVPVQPVTTASAAPLAVAGAAAVVVGEPSTYSFSGDGPGLVADAWAARMHGDGQAAERLHRFNSELLGGNTQSALALAAVLKTTDLDDIGAPLGAFQTTTRLPLREAIDRGRPLLSRITTVPIRNAQPFLLPIEGEFDGVGDHTEGTAHRAEGVLSLGDATMTPKAMDGAYRLSREIVDSTNPAIDRIALRAMLRDYRRKTEAKFLAALNVAAGAATAVAGPIPLDLALLMFGDDDSDEPTFVAGSKQAVANLASYVDGDGRQLLPAVGPTNAPGTRRAGATGYSIGGAELVKSASITGTDVLAVDEQDVLVAESPVQTFRFDEVEGPGIIKLALFAYFGAAVLDADGVERYSVAAYVAP